MSRQISVAVLAVGILLLILGLIAYDSTSSDISQFFTGSPSDRATWMLAGGFIGTALGLVSLSRTWKRT